MCQVEQLRIAASLLLPALLRSTSLSRERRFLQSAMSVIRELRYQNIEPEILLLIARLSRAHGPPIVSVGPDHPPVLHRVVHIRKRCSAFKLTYRVLMPYLFSLFSLSKEFSVSAQSTENLKHDVFCPLAAVSYWSDSRGASVFARTRANKFERTVQQSVPSPVGRLAKSDPSWKRWALACRPFLVRTVINVPGTRCHARAKATTNVHLEAAAAWLDKCSTVVHICFSWPEKLSASAFSRPAATAPA